ncbi:putative bifunctional fatty acid transporter/acyl-CoA synthetase [Exophiala viscosa]|uniref:Bifunctional fatty acid transporter/acyl-CoA synthetase n=1 Tax=Exophiala viscosa TaxID=2486360 RepID=A0AAN6DMR8_9EURO|nr:putative bifunctional fatty acid transporter/acyl-CoA synthetase [Exophiala viscosa]KAI1620069.1 putative bifunctional fatty acid transporter/acyl-CoA synthetase [Exophiala viscosa]
MDTNSLAATAAKVAVASVAGLASYAYLDAKVGIGADVKQLRHDRSWRRRLDQRIKDLGGDCSLYRLFEQADQAADALWFENQSWTYGQLRDDADRVATILDRHNVGPGRCVAVFTTNTPEMVITCLALSKLGSVMALINTNLRDATLQHCLNVANADLIIVTPDLAAFAPTGISRLVLNLYSFNEPGPATGHGDDDHDKTVIRVTLDELCRTEPFFSTRNQRLADVAILIYTSGTTGKPKACAIRNMQIMVTSNPLTSDVENSKLYYPLRTYSPLPLFHGTAFFTGFTYVVGCSGTLCLRRKFSVTHFFEDMVLAKATRMLYIGELCRYLIAAPASQYDRLHKCIVAHGNGMRKDIWQPFMERYNIPEIREFYRSTEGLAKFDNHGRGVWGAGSIGFSGPLGRLFEDQTFLVKVDPETQEPVRDARTGFCQKAGLGEPGEAIGRCRDRSLLTEYFGNTEATEGKMLANVFQKGDLFQRMGDFLTQDASGWVQFSDRMGDTFRWKGENVSTAEVRDFICGMKEVQDAVVYGVKLDKYDGQAGGAAIVLKTNDAAIEKLFTSNLRASLRDKGLPDYAVPRLVRITASIAAGDTYKQAKNDVARRDWSPRGNTHGDNLYILQNSTFKPLTDSSWEQVEQGKEKL